MKTYIYTLADPRTNEVRYVGKTINVKRRYHYHCSEFQNKQEHTHRSCWLLSLIKLGLKPIMTVVTECENDWSRLEQEWISKFDNLCNHTKGGEGIVGLKRSEETKRKISENNARGRSRKVYQFTLDGKFINEYQSAIEAANKNGCDGIKIAAACRGVQHSSCGYCWSYSKEIKIKPPRKYSNKWKQLNLKSETTQQKGE